MFYFLNPQTLIAVAGLVGIIGIVFAETGLFFGFFLPGDSLLFTAGLLASEHHLPLAGLLIGAFIAAVAGDSVGYAFGKKVGPAIFTKEDSIFFDKKHIARAQHFYEKYGKKTIILARFLPIIRTFAPIVAGVGMMPYRVFIAFNIIGALLWTGGMILLGYVFGSLIPNPDRYIIPMVIVIIVLSATPTLREIFRKRV
ncbi:MAG: DedA family protein [Patescibacteria group bacterium]